jgi:hypothetical protein
MKALKLLTFTFISSCILLSCKKPSCSNNIKDGKEINVDCGGNCPACIEKSNEPESPQIPSSYLIGTWYFLKSCEVHLPFYSNSASVWLKIHNDANLCKVQFTDQYNADSTKKCYGVLGSSNYPTEGAWKYDSTAYSQQIKTGPYSINYMVKSLTNNSMKATMGYTDEYYSKTMSQYIGVVPQVQIELKIYSALPANALVADGEVLSAGQTSWIKTYTGTGNNALFNVTIAHPSGSTATGSVTLEMIVKDMDGNVLISSGKFSALLEGNPPPPPGQSDGPAQGNLNLSYKVTWGV